MRLSQSQRELILSGVREFVGPSVAVHVFGSRLDDSKRGGDVDLLLDRSLDVTRVESVAADGDEEALGYFWVAVHAAWPFARACVRKRWLTL